MLIFDGDYPMAYGGIDLNRDLTLPLSEVRAQDETPDNVAFASLPELRRAGVAAALMKFTVRRLLGEFPQAQILPSHLDTTAIMDLESDVTRGGTDLLVDEVDHLGAVEPGSHARADDPYSHRVPLAHAQRAVLLRLGLDEPAAPVRLINAA